jgi:hypothetical protein
VRKISAYRVWRKPWPETVVYRQPANRYGLWMHAKATRTTGPTAWQSGHRDQEEALRGQTHCLLQGHCGLRLQLWLACCATAPLCMLHHSARWYTHPPTTLPSQLAGLGHLLGHESSTSPTTFAAGLTLVAAWETGSQPLEA